MKRALAEFTVIGLCAIAGVLLLPGFLLLAVIGAVISRQQQPET